MRRSVSVALVTLSLLAAASARAYTVDLANPEGLTLGGTAAFVGATLTLTPDRTNSGGSAFWGCPLRVGQDTWFSVSLSFYIDGEEGTGGADGLAVVMQAGPTGSHALGAVGGELAFGGVAPGVGLELDTWRNSNDPSDNHVALVSSSAPGKHLALAASPVDLNGGGAVFLWLDWDGASARLEVRLSDKPARPAALTLATTLPLETLVGHLAYVGLVAATGARRNAHHVTAWTVEAGGQVDTDTDGLLDDCDPDDDGDGVPDAEDVCPLTPDPDQADADQDGIGDACDEAPDDGALADADDDGLTNEEEADFGTDPFVADSDGDGILDGDERTGEVMRDSDGDGFIDALDSDADGDGVLDIAEAGDNELETPPVDSDADGVPDFQDLDSDDDGVPDKRDRCRTIPDPEQLDSDGDGIGDACQGGDEGSEAGESGPAGARPSSPGPEAARPAEGAGRVLPSRRPTPQSTLGTPDGAPLGARPSPDPAPGSVPLARPSPGAEGGRQPGSEREHERDPPARTPSARDRPRAPNRDRDARGDGDHPDGAEGLDLNDPASRSSGSSWPWLVPLALAFVLGVALFGRWVRRRARP